jgi:hypothetical protein
MQDEPTWQPALLLAGAGGKGDTLVVPPGACVPGQTIEIYTDAFARWRVGAVAGRGTDFERVAIAPAE